MAGGEFAPARFKGIEKAPGVKEDDPRATPYDDEFRAGKDRALAEAGYKVIRLDLSER